ncbi:hypothetical protein [Clavibacter nebraskensis]|uniref:Uncharacterized protein n=1 Tax=Clavibacter nebraskensis TaxID=31963 RepID=A0A399QMB6_9MICO|nr:hypothetical protein [Clavibacter nebraskensis]RIJ19444.1 hypothetical protein DZF97_00680 [Clavibacter nebraskensis]UKF27075.1 hypothetical protein FGQ65_01840 [Clavibacter nebraskensis]
MDTPQYGVGFARSKSSAEPSSPPTEEQIRRLANALTRILPTLRTVNDVLWQRQEHAGVKRRNVLDLDSHSAQKEAAAAVRLAAFRNTPKPALIPELNLLVAVPNGPNADPKRVARSRAGVEVAA